MVPEKSSSLPTNLPPWLLRVNEKIQDEFSETLRTKDLADWMAVHPVYLARIYRKFFHCSIKTKIQELRIQQAIQELSTGQKPLSLIALDAGFADQAHLSRTFRKVVKRSPAAFRKWVTRF